MGYYKRTNIPATCSGDHTPTELDEILKGLGKKDTAVVVTDGVDVAEYERITGHRYTYVNELMKSYR